MTKMIELPKDQFASQLELRDGYRITAEVRGDIVYLTIIDEDCRNVKEMDKKTPVNFAGKWAGKFSSLSDSELSDDPRAQAILNR